MKIKTNELLGLAAIGAAYEANFAKDMGDTKIAEHFTKILNTITQAKTIEDIIENPT